MALHSTLKRLFSLIALAALMLAIYVFGVRSAASHWGATAEEIARPMPGDTLISHPTFLATRAITIAGRPQDIWPWLVQIGYGRAGFYGYDLIENIGSKTGIRSAVSILPEFQHPKPEDKLPLSSVAGVIFDAVQPDKYLVWRGDISPQSGAFTWALYPIDENHTRLVSRVRLRYHWTDRHLALDLFTEFGDPVAVRKILLGVKDRVEGRAPQSLAAEAVEIAVWLLALAELGMSTWLVLRRRRWGRALLLVLASASLLLVVLYAYPPIWAGVALTVNFFATLIWVSQTDALNEP
jgi:hypothetical protein